MLHKPFETIPKFRPIVAYMGTFKYNLAAFLSELVKKVTPMDHSCSDTFTSLKDLGNQNIEGKFIISFDIPSLFTNIPLEGTAELAV